MTATLTEDIYSHSKKGLYGAKGDQVRITADFVNVAIVESKTGQKFPVLKTKLIYEDKNLHPVQAT